MWNNFKPVSVFTFVLPHQLIGQRSHTVNTGGRSHNSQTMGQSIYWEGKGRWLGDSKKCKNAHNFFIWMFLWGFVFICSFSLRKYVHWWLYPVTGLKIAHGHRGHDCCRCPKTWSYSAPESFQVSRYSSALNAFAWWP